MQNEILKPVLDTDEVAVPRYDIVGPNGSVIQQNVELRLKNEVVQEGTPYDEESVLPASLREQLELPQSATPAEAMTALMAKSGGAVRRNRPPLTTDVERVGKLWVVPEMFFNNLMPDALTQVAGNWHSSNAAVTVSGNTATFTGNGTESSVDVQASMLASAKAGDKIFVQATVKVNHDANNATIQLTCGEQTLATQALNVPAAGDTMLLQAVAIVENDGALALRVRSAYNTAAVQSGKSVTVSAITVWNLTEDMCEAQESNEFTEQEAANYISSFGQFQTKEYEYSTWWWVLRGVSDDQYLWHRMYDYATQAEAQAGVVDTKLMTPLRTQQFLTGKIATQTEVNASTDNTKIVTPATLAGKTATQAEAQAGSNNTKIMTPLRVKNFHDAVKASTDEAKAGSSTTKWINPNTLMAAIDWYERSSYMAFCANVNADALDAAFGKNNVTNIRAIGNQLAMYSWFKGAAASAYPYTVTRTLHTLSQIYANINAVLEVEQSTAVLDLIQASPFAKAIRDAAISNEAVCCQIIAAFSGLSNPTSFTTVAALTNNSTFMNSQTNVARAFTYPTFLSVFCGSDTHWTRMTSYTACMKAFQASSEVNTYLEANKDTLLTYLQTSGTNVSTALTGNAVYIHSCSSINSGNYSNNSFSLGVDLNGTTYSSSGSGDSTNAAKNIGRKFFKPSTCSKGGGGGVTCYYKKIS